MDGDGKSRRTSVCDGVMDQADKTVISKIMQRFRPIAPKPTVGESCDDTKSCRFLGRNRRSKRKYVRYKNISSRNNSRDRIISKSKSCNNDKEKIKTDLDNYIDGNDTNNIITLQLLPEKDLAGEYCSDLSDTDPKPSLYCPTIELSTSLYRTVVASWLLVECVSDTCSDLGGNNILELCRMAHGEERMMRMLEVDTCPCLVSDDSNRVSWVNRAYRRMMGATDTEVIRVWLVVAKNLMEELSCMVELYGAVTCRVRVRYEPATWTKESEVKMTVPCDVWRIRSGGFAWRLDVESALKLGM